MGNEAWGDRTAIYRHISEVMKRLGLEAPTYGYTENHAALVMILNGFLECEKRLEKSECKHLYFTASADGRHKQCRTCYAMLGEPPP